MNVVMSLVRQYQLVAFVGLTFAISWVIWISMIVGKTSIATPGGSVLNALAIAGPTVAALVVAMGLGGSQFRDLVAGLSLARMSARWVVTALALPIVMIAIAIIVGVAFFGTVAPTFSIAVIGVLASEFVRVFFFGGPLGEEIGWRGFALPRLQARRTALGASLLLGLIWGLWHIPLYFVPGTGQFETVSGGMSAHFAIGAFVVWTIGLSILFTWLFNQTRGSLIVVMLFHASINLGAFVPAAVGSTGAASFLYALVTWIVALVVVSLYRKTTLARGPAMTVTSESQP